MVKVLVRDGETGKPIEGYDVPVNRLHILLNGLIESPLEYIEIIKGGELEGWEMRGKGLEIAKRVGRDFDFTIFKRRVVIKGGERRE